MVQEIKEKLLTKMEQYKGFVDDVGKIYFTILSKSRKCTEHLAVELAERGDSIKYKKDKTNIFEITGVTLEKQLNEKIIKDWILEMNERCIKNECVLQDYSIIA